MNRIFLSIQLLCTITAWSQTKQNVDFTTGDAHLKFDISQRKVLGSVVYNMQVHAMTDSVYIDAKNMHIKQIKINDQIVKYNYNRKKIALYTGYKEGENNVNIQYEAVPKAAIYWKGNGTDLQIWTQMKK